MTGHPTGWAASPEPQQHYLVEPRHLAGGGDLRHVTEFLRACGWKDRAPRRRTGLIILESPDRTIRIGYDPHTEPGGWTVSARPTGQEAWQATFSHQTPVEVIAGLTDTLTLPRSAHAPNVWAPLEEAGWERGRSRHHTMVSPDRGAFVTFHTASPGGPSHWRAGARNEHGRAWDALFTTATPLYLVQAVTPALADPRPVMRPRGHLPHTRQIRTTSVSVLPAELAAWQQARITEARARTWALSTAADPRTSPGPGPGLRSVAGSRRR
nr:DUF317 domain-containing protein [Streptomyces acidiscabies]